MPKCNILGCGARRNKNQPNLTFHRMPRNDSKRRKWLERIGCDNINPNTKETLICSLHFEESDYNRTLGVLRLRDDALPSHHLLGSESTPKTLLRIQRREKRQNEPAPSTSSSFKLQMCRICLVSNSQVKMFHMDTYIHLKNYYCHLVNILVMEDDGRTPQYICWECARHLMNSNELRIKALKSISILSSLLEANQPISTQKLNKLTRESNNLASNLKSIIFHDEDICVKPKILADDDGAMETLDDELLQETQDHVHRPLDPLLEPKRENDITVENEALESVDQNTKKEYVDDVNDYVNEDDKYVYLYVDSLDDNNSLVKKENETVENVPNESERNTGCGEAFSKSSAVMGIEIIDPGERPYSCTYCEKAFKQSSDLKRHNMTHTGERPFSCNVCGKAFNRLIQLKGHERIHTGEKPFACTVCGKAFRLSVNLKIHIRIHTGEKPYSCIVCGKSFNQSSHLKKHNMIHTGETPYSCKVCGKSFNQLLHLKRHERTHTGEKPYPCSVCGKSFSEPLYLKLHTRIHTGEKPYTCNVCGKTFNQSSYLKIHNMSHTGETPYTCNVCGKAFSQPGTLKIHKLTHSAETRYLCNICGKSFKQSSHFKKHSMTHTGEKPYCCNVCGKAFSMSFYLKTHSRIHTGETPYSCDECGKTFKQRSHLKRHNIIHTGERAYSCDTCPQKFKYKISLDKHVLKHEKI